MALDQDALNALRLDRNAPPPAAGPRGSRHGWFIWVGVALVAVLAGAVLLRPKPLEVTTATAVALPANAAPAPVLDASGYVVARRQATVSAKTTGKVLDIKVEEGMAVRKGQVLAELDPSQALLQQSLAQRQIEAADGSLAEAKVRLLDARRTLERDEKVYAARLISEAAVDASRTQVAALEAQRAALEGQRAVYVSTSNLRAQDLEDLIVRAPFDGMVISKDAQPGEMVSPISAGGGFTRTGIATIVDMGSREIEVDVNEAYINRVHDGQRTEATLDAYPDWNIPSHVINIVPTADRQKATVKVRIGFDALDPRVLPDMGVKVRFLAEAAPAPTAADTALKAGVVLIPADALVSDASQSFVWKLVAEHAHRVPVTAGATREGNLEITAGLNSGDIVISAPPAGLTDGARVRSKAAS